MKGFGRGEKSAYSLSPRGPLLYFISFGVYLFFNIIFLYFYAQYGFPGHATRYLGEKPASPISVLCSCHIMIVKVLLRI
jgi:hypothetical protein